MALLNCLACTTHHCFSLLNSQNTIKQCMHSVSVTVPWLPDADRARVGSWQAACPSCSCRLAWTRSTTSDLITRGANLTRQRWNAPSCICAILAAAPRPVALSEGQCRRSWIRSILRLFLGQCERLGLARSACSFQQFLNNRSGQLHFFIASCICTYYSVGL